MAGTRIHLLQAAAAAILLAVSAAAHAVVYKWVEEDGKVIYSNEPPPDQSKVRELTRIDDLELVPVDRRESLPTDREKRSSPSAVATPLPAAPEAREPVALVPREPATLVPREPVTLLPREPAAASREAEAPPRVMPRSTHTGAVQDPCLTSSDRRCHELNKGSYHPFLGYSPPSGPVPQAVGVSSSAAAGGAVGAQVPVAQTAAVPQPQKRGAQALPPGTAAIEWTKPVR